MDLEEILTQTRTEPAEALERALDKIAAQLAHLPEA
jgi:DNA-directed RNA polymerase subunit L